MIGIDDQRLYHYWASSSADLRYCNAVLRGADWRDTANKCVHLYTRCDSLCLACAASANTV